MKCIFLLLDCLKNEHMPCEPSEKSNKRVYLSFFIYLFFKLLHFPEKFEDFKKSCWAVPCVRVK